jgi:tRNA pseudouridine55 synthase
MPVVPLYKPLGWTPLQMLDLLRERRQDLRDKPMTYAGRLDPMAEGLLLVLVGDERFKKPEFIKLDKVYLAEILFGVETDTYDVLGIIQNIKPTHDLDEEAVRKKLNSLVGVCRLPFPPYSSFEIQGVPLHYWARTGRLGEIEIPKKDMVVRDVDVVRVCMRDAQELRREVIERIEKVRGAFRQNESIEDWMKKFANVSGKFLSAHVRLHVDSGTYVRAIAHYVGQELGVGGCLIHLKREKVGEYSVENALQLFF